MNLRNDPIYLKSHQYKTSKNLDARINLHQKYSTNPVAWNTFVLNQILDLNCSTILEVGSGSGELWKNNAISLFPSAKVFLSDFSIGMLKNLSQNLKGSTIKNISNNDVQWLPYPDESFDLVIANHMLYHVPDIDQALSEMKRVLTPNGSIMTATNGEGHMKELDLLAKKFLPEVQEIYKISTKYSLENARSYLDKHFSEIKLIQYPGMLVIPDVNPILNYIVSIWGNFISDLQLKSIQEELERVILLEQNFIIHKSSGIFISKK